MKLKLFNRFLLDLGRKVHDLKNDVIRLGIITGTPTPDITMEDPRWTIGGTIDFSDYEVIYSQSYSGPLLVMESDWFLLSSIPTYIGQVLPLYPDLLGFDDARYAILYNDVNKKCIGYLDFETTVSIKHNMLKIDFQGEYSNIFSLSNKEI